VVNFSGFFAKLKISRGFLCKSLILKEGSAKLRWTGDNIFLG
jgi:hypothetical protein